MWDSHLCDGRGRYVGFVPAASATHVQSSTFFTVNRYTYPGLLLLL